MSHWQALDLAIAHKRILQLEDALCRIAVMHQEKDVPTALLKLARCQSIALKLLDKPQAVIEATAERLHAEELQKQENS